VPFNLSPSEEPLKKMDSKDGRVRPFNEGVGENGDANKLDTGDA